MIGGFRSVLCVSVLQGSLLVIVIMIGGSENRYCECTFKNKSYKFRILEVNPK